MSSNDAFQYLTKRALTLGSGSQLLFIKREYEENNIKKERIIPVLALTGVNQSNNSRDFNIITSREANGEIGIVTTELDESNKLITTIQDSIEINSMDSEHSDWLKLEPSTDTVVYPRIFIKSLQVKTNSDALVLKYEDEENLDQNQIINYVPLKEYEEYSVLTRSLDQQYVLTLKPEVVVKKGAYGTIDGSIATRQATLNYTISNADTSIYLDAIEVLKENAMPKVEYDVKPNVFATKYCETLYNKLGNIIRINDNELKFKNIRGYISGLTLDLDNPDEDTIEVKNYKTKFEDLFSTITAQTEAMKKNNGLMQSVAAAFTSSGELSETVLQSSIKKVDLDYAFNNGKLTIDEHNGIWGTSDTGVVAFRGGGIFTATEKNTQGNWKWNTGITPEGINADLITSGQLDTNLIKIYSGDNVRFQINGDGIFAYKNQTTNAKRNYSDNAPQETITADNSIDSLQYVRFYDEGLALVAKRDAKVLNHNATDYITVLKDNYDVSEIKRVEIGWRGLILRNWENKEVFYADADTGNLTLKGRIEASSGKIGAWNIDDNKIWADSEVSEAGNYTTFVALNAGGTTKENEKDQIVKSDGTHYLIDPNKGDTEKNWLYAKTSPYAFWAGSPNPAEAKFSIQKNGAFTATDGMIGGWHLTADRLYNNTALVLASTKQAYQESDVFIPKEDTDQSTSGTTYSNNTVLWIPKKASQLTSEDVGAANAPFRIDADGTVKLKKILIPNANVNATKLIEKNYQNFFRGGTFVGASGIGTSKITLSFTNGSVTFDTAAGLRVRLSGRRSGNNLIITAQPGTGTDDDFKAMGTPSSTTLSINTRKTGGGDSFVVVRGWISSTNTSGTSTSAEVVLYREDND